MNNDSMTLGTANVRLFRSTITYPYHFSARWNIHSLSHFSARWNIHSLSLSLPLLNFMELESKGKKKEYSNIAGAGVM